MSSSANGEQEREMERMRELIRQLQQKESEYGSTKESWRLQAGNISPSDVYIFTNNIKSKCNYELGCSFRWSSRTDMYTHSSGFHNNIRSQNYLIIRR